MFQVNGGDLILRSITSDDDAFKVSVGTVAMADANQTPDVSVYRCLEIECTGALTADRNLTLPIGVTAGKRRAWWIRNSTTGGHNVVVKGVTGATVAIAAGKCALLGVSTDGADIVRFTVDA